MAPDCVVASIVALLYLIIAIRKAQRFKFLALYLLYERKQRDLTNTRTRLAARLMNRLCEQRQSAGERRGYIQDHRDGLKKYTVTQSCLRCGKMTFEFLYSANAFTNHKMHFKQLDKLSAK